ncbi:MAG TPA: sigma 54-interacting transcriptional regulator, partial [Syntrophobacteria bacterium]|nr:sigma 54-interacting transcriptional regulator [Syntrophobacteria bacterium]
MVQVIEKEKILVIDDEESTLAMLRLLLAAEGYTVLTAKSGEAGLELFREQSPPLALTDIRMPGMDGIDVLKRVKEEDPTAEVIVITGHGDMEMAIQALHYGASDFINKPVAKRTLDIALGRAQEKIRLRRQLQEYTDTLEARVKEATAELDKSCRRLQTLCEIHQSVAEMPSLGDILGFLHQKIESLTGLRSRLILVLNSQGDRVLDHLYDPGAVRVTAHLVGMIQELDCPRLLTHEERQQIFLEPLPPEGERTAVLPIWIRNEAPVGIAFVGTAAEKKEDELRFATLLLSQAAGAIRRAAGQEEELRALRRQAGVEAKFGDLIGRHQKMQTIYRLVAGIAESEASVLIQGESGTGKELIAKLLHQLSPRRDQPFVVINCGAYPQTLIESELFGHERGAFTGAIQARRGCFEQANGGTIFLDEIGEVPTEAQVKLLRVLQFKEFQRLGGESTIKVDVRV